MRDEQNCLNDCRVKKNTRRYEPRADFNLNLLVDTCVRLCCVDYSDTK